RQEQQVSEPGLSIEHRQFGRGLSTNRDVEELTVGITTDVDQDSRARIPGRIGVDPCPCADLRELSCNKVRAHGSLLKKQLISCNVSYAPTGSRTRTASLG